jgi:hypothetical protein
MVKVCANHNGGFAFSGQMADHVRRRSSLDFLLCQINDATTGLIKPFFQLFGSFLVGCGNSFSATDSFVLFQRSEPYPLGNARLRPAENKQSRNCARKHGPAHGHAILHGFGDKFSVLVADLRPGDVRIMREHGEPLPG